MTSGGTPGAPVRASRTRRRDVQHRQRTVELLAAIVVVVAGAWYGSVQARMDGGPAGSSRSSPTPARPATMLVLSVTGAPKPLVAVIGEGGPHPPATMAFPVGLTIVVPGQGEATTRRVASLPGPSLQVAVSNALGAWVAHYAVTDLAHLADLVDRSGGVRVLMPAAVTVGSDVLGPGRVKLTGAELQAYLSADGVDTFTRWEVALQGLLAHPPTLEQPDLTETDSLEGAAAALEQAVGAQQATLPIQIAAAAVRVPKYPALDALMARTFGVTRAPVPVIVQNGSGVAGIGEEVARKIIPRGFRVVLSENAQTFDHKVTQIIAVQNQSVAFARRVRAALGVGRVAVTQVPSGIGDVVIVVGKDFKA